jgi:NADH-quinone oxidoreductase subunit J
VGIALMGPYILGVELSSLLLTAGLIGAYHLGKRKGDASQIEEVRIGD